MPDPVRVLVIGAHPDDCDVSAGGLAATYVREGHTVKFLSMTNGDTGHHEIGGGDLARRRYAETQASAKVIGIEYEVHDHHCGELMPTIENRRFIIRAIRLFKPDLVLTHAPDDYHPDHRYTSTLVQDAAYLVTVPGTVALTPHLRHNPVFGYVQGSVTTSSLFTPDVLIDIDPVLEAKLDMVCCHESQFTEWIPYNQNRLDEVPDDAEGKRQFVRDWFMNRATPFVERYRDELVDRFGPERVKAMRAAEAVAACPFGAPLDEAAIERLFPFDAARS